VWDHGEEDGVSSGHDFPFVEEAKREPAVSRLTPQCEYELSDLFPRSRLDFPGIVPVI